MNWIYWKFHFLKSRSENTVENINGNRNAAKRKVKRSKKSAENETEQVKTEVAEQLSGVNLSPADIDAIAEKVVEKLTARMKE